MSDRELECRGTVWEETPNAIQVSRTLSAARHWIPRSQIAYMKRAGASVTFTLPVWLIEKKECWDLVP